MRSGRIARSRERLQADQGQEGIHRIEPMKTITITQARRRLGELVQAQETVQVTHRGVLIGTLDASAQADPPHDREREMAAAQSIRELSDRLAAKRKPSKKHGATAAVRALRDHGR